MQNTLLTETEDSSPTVTVYLTVTAASIRTTPSEVLKWAFHLNNSHARVSNSDLFLPLVKKELWGGIDYLLNNYVSPENKENAKSLVLIYALEQNKPSSISYALTLIAETNLSKYSIKETGYYAIHLAAKNKHEALVLAMLNTDPQLLYLKSNEQKETLFIILAKANEWELISTIVKTYHQQNNNYHYRSQYGIALVFALKTNTEQSRACALILVQHDATFNHSLTEYDHRNEDNINQNAIHFSAKHPECHPLILVMLRKNPRILIQMNTQNETCINILLRLNATNTIKEILAVLLIKKLRYMELFFQQLRDAEKEYVSNLIDSIHIDYPLHKVTAILTCLTQLNGAFWVRRLLTKPTLYNGTRFPLLKELYPTLSEISGDILQGNFLNHIIILFNQLFIDSHVEDFDRLKKGDNKNQSWSTLKNSTLLLLTQYNSNDENKNYIKEKDIQRLNKISNWLDSVAPTKTQQSSAGWSLSPKNSPARKSPTTAALRMEF